MLRITLTRAICSCRSLCSKTNNSFQNRAAAENQLFMPQTGKRPPIILFFRHYISHKAEILTILTCLQENSKKGFTGSLLFSESELTLSSSNTVKSVVILYYNQPGKQNKVSLVYKNFFLLTYVLQYHMVSCNYLQENKILLKCNNTFYLMLYDINSCCNVTRMQFSF